MHLVALVFPRQVAQWNTALVRLYALELTGLALALWSLVGLAILVWRRLGDKNILAITSPLDLVVLALLLLSVVTGIIIATDYRFGSYWFTVIFAPYLWSVFTLRPIITGILPLPWIIKLHALNFFILLAVFPFCRLIHIITYPLGYVIRPWQIVIRTKRRQSKSVLQGGQARKFL